jgi:uncharacterized protein YggU (UPF0235/DUF167 family)
LTGRPPFARTATGLRIAARLTPKAGEDRIDGVTELSSGDAVLSVRVRSAPEDGRANAALEKLVAAALGLPKSSVAVTAGHKSRLKQVTVTGDPAALLDAAGRLWPSSANVSRTER